MKQMRDENTIQNRICSDDLIARACILQAKWNGTTVEEEYKKTMAYKKKYKQSREEGESHEAWELLDNKVTAPILLKSEKEACIYHNRFIKGIKQPCEGNVCNKDCPNCIRR